MARSRLRRVSGARKALLFESSLQPHSFFDQLLIRFARLRPLSPRPRNSAM